MIIKTQNEKYEEDIALLLQKGNYTLVKYSLIKQEQATLLKVIIYREVGISHKDCQQVTKLIQQFFVDKELSLDFSIEVSSPGLYRELKTFRELKLFQGQKVIISLLQENKVSQETGILLESSPNQINVASDIHEKKTFPVEVINKIRLVE